MAIEPTARNSDCQFCKVFSQKSVRVRYSPHETGFCWWSSRPALYSVTPVIDCANQVATQIAPITSSSEFLVQSAPDPGDLRPARRVRLSMLTYALILVGPRPSVPSCFDSGEPRCRSQTVSSLKSVTEGIRCQFSITAVPNSEDTR